MPTFILNDENVKNSYGFKIPNKGVSLKRFKANPVMLDQHWNSTRAVLGRWTNIGINDKGQLTADDDFDADDEDALKVKGKVERGFIKGASMGVTFNREKMKQMPDGSWELTECEVYEASIVAIPSNSAALRLYAADTGELLSDEAVKLELSALQENSLNFNLTNMNKLVLSAMALVVLGLQNTDDTAQLCAAIENMAAENKKLKADCEALKLSIKTQAKERAKTILDNAQLEGRILATERADYEELAENNPALCEKMLAKLEAKQTLGGSVNNTTQKGAASVKTMDDFQALTLAQQLEFKTANPDAYKALFA